MPDLTGLVTACRDAGGLAGRRLTAAGLRASFESTATRSIAAWIAKPRPADIPAPSRPRPAIIPAPSRPRPAETDAPLVGLVSLVTTPRRHAIGWLLVHPAARRQGVGRALAAAAIDFARERAAREIWVEVHPDWSGAWAFWRSVGFLPA